MVGVGVSSELAPAETFPAGTGHNPGVHDTLLGLSPYTHLHPSGRGLHGGRARSGSTSRLLFFRGLVFVAFYIRFTDTAHTRSSI